MENDLKVVNNFRFQEAREDVSIRARASSGHEDHVHGQGRQPHLQDGRQGCRVSVRGS